MDRVPTGKVGRPIVYHARVKFGFISGSKLILKRKNYGDYYSQINSQIFYSRFRNMQQLLEEPRVIVIDNSPYHSLLVENVQKTNMRRANVQNWLNAQKASNFPKQKFELNFERHL